MSAHDPDADASLLVAAVEAAFAIGGPLHRADPGYRPREAQRDMAAAVARAVAQREPLVVEASTGVGKTFGYLVPVLLSGCRTMISTATKTLQDQLYQRDLPRLRDALQLPVRIALLKGRSSYVCLHRLERARHDAQLPDRLAVRTLAQVERWAPTTRTGDLAEIDGLNDRSPVIPLVTSSRDNCLGSDCPKFQGCWVVKARREALAADVVVVNHHLFFADVALRDGGVAEILPTVEVAVFDEAHQLTEAGIGFLGVQLGTAACVDLARDLLATGLQRARGLADWAAVAAACDRAARQLRLACAGASRELRGALRLRWEERARDDAFRDGVAGVAAAFDAARMALDTVSEIAPEFPRLIERAAALAQHARRFGEPRPDGSVRWIDVSSLQARLVESPLDIRDAMAEQRERAPKAWVFTSATLGDDASLSWFTGPAGLDDARTCRLGSPFDYASHACLYVPPDLPLPNDARHPSAVAALALRLARALGGRTFVLTTTLRALGAIAETLESAIAAGHDGLQVLAQGRSPKRELIARFLSEPGSILVGSQSFWEGVDVPGAALQCVLIDKLPFPPPQDPLVEARTRRIKADGGSPFDAYHVPEAIVALKQGAGRLIRSETDRGLLVIADPRLLRMGYGRRVLAALPPMRRLAEEADCLDFLAELAAGHPGGGSAG